MRGYGWATALCAVALVTILWLPTEAPAYPASSPGGGDVIAYVDVRRLTLTLYVDREKVGRWPVACGTADSPTPIGVWRVTGKIRGAGQVFGTRWLALSCPWGSYGIHGTDAPASIGQKVSNGCVRMLNRDVEKLYEALPLGAAVVIEDSSATQLRNPPTLEPGDRGSVVMALQGRLRALTYFDGLPDGIFGVRTAAAVYAFKLDVGLKPDVAVDSKTYRALGMIPFE